MLIETSDLDALGGDARGLARRCIAKTPLDGVLVASPANPTGTMMRPEALAALIRAAEESGIKLHLRRDLSRPRLRVPGRDRACGISDAPLVINSFSKYFCMTGWRIGWIVAPEPMVRPIERLQENLAISVPHLSQIAAEAAFDGRDEMDAVKHGYEENRRILIARLAGRGARHIPAGGRRVLSLCRYPRFSDDSFDFARRLLQEAHVAATPGVDFDPLDGRHYPLLLCRLAGRDARGGGADRPMAQARLTRGRERGCNSWKTCCR